MKKRIVVLVTVAALMVVLLATSVAPAYGKVHIWLCEQPDGSAEIAVGNKHKKDSEDQGFTCTRF
jgi:hypothetical protein